MKIKLHEQEYDLAAAASKAHLNDLMELKVKTRIDGRPGVDVKTIRAAFLRMGNAFTNAKGDSPDLTDEQLGIAVSEAFLELLSDDDFVDNFIGIMFLARRRNGEKVTIQQAGEFAFSEIEWVIADDDDSDEGENGESGDAVPFTAADGEAEPTTI